MNTRQADQAEIAPVKAALVVQGQHQRLACRDKPRPQLWCRHGPPLAVVRFRGTAGDNLIVDAECAIRLDADQVAGQAIHLFAQGTQATGTKAAAHIVTFLGQAAELRRLQTEKSNAASLWYIICQPVQAQRQAGCHIESETSKPEQGKHGRKEAE